MQHNIENSDDLFQFQNEENFSFITDNNQQRFDISLNK